MRGPVRPRRSLSVLALAAALLPPALAGCGVEEQASTTGSWRLGDRDLAGGQLIDMAYDGISRNPGIGAVQLFRE